MQSLWQLLVLWIIAVGRRRLLPLRPTFPLIAAGLVRFFRRLSMLGLADQRLLQQVSVALGVIQAGDRLLKLLIGGSATPLTAVQPGLYPQIRNIAALQLLLEIHLAEVLGDSRSFLLTNKFLLVEKLRMATSILIVFIGVALLVLQEIPALEILKFVYELVLFEGGAAQWHRCGGREGSHAAPHRLVERALLVRASIIQQMLLRANRLLRLQCLWHLLSSVQLAALSLPGGIQLLLLLDEARRQQFTLLLVGGSGFYAVHGVLLLHLLQRPFERDLAVGVQGAGLLDSGLDEFEKDGVLLDALCSRDAAVHVFYREF